MREAEGGLAKERDDRRFEGLIWRLRLCYVLVAVRTVVGQDRGKRWKAGRKLWLGRSSSWANMSRKCTAECQFDAGRRTERASSSKFANSSE